MKIVEMNIVEVIDGIVCQQVNCRNRIGAGVSGAIIKKWPEVEQAYHGAFNGKDPRTEIFGTYQLVPVSDQLSIANVFSQFYYGNARKTGQVYTNMDILTKCIAEICHKNEQKTVYVPDHIGCGLAGGNWDEFIGACRSLDNLVVCCI